jgi:Asp-tRNA(Asn)/Glu-tRNA(Gln) amidotransferase A subunit family amidase
MSCESSPEPYVEKLRADLKGKRIAFSPDLGHARVESEVAELTAKAVRAFEELGAIVEHVTPAWGRSALTSRASSGRPATSLAARPICRDGETRWTLASSR